MSEAAIISIGAWVSVWVLFFLFIRHLILSEEKHQKLRNTIRELLDTQQKATADQKEFHKTIALLMGGITQNLNQLKEVNIDNVREIIQREVDARLKHVAQ